MFWKALNGVHGVSDVLSEGFNNGIFPCIIIAAVVGVGKVVLRYGGLLLWSRKISSIYLCRVF